MEIEFETERVTTNTVRMQEVVEEGNAQKMGTIYLSNHLIKKMGLGDPKSIKKATLEVKSVSA